MGQNLLGTFPLTRTMDVPAQQMDRFRNMFKIRRTIFEMLRDRGYSVPDADLEQTLQDFVNRFGNQNVSGEALNIFQSKLDDRGERILVFFCDHAKPGVDIFKSYLEKMKGAEASRGIVVVEQDISAFARRSLEHLSKTSNKYTLECFFHRELLVNITKHHLVPQHEVLTQEEKLALRLGLSRLKDTQLPRLLATDPIARYYGLKSGQVVKITRPSETAGRYVTCRLVLG